MTDSGKIFDGLLVLKYRSGTREAFDVLVNKYHKRLCKHSYWYTHDIDASKDIVQDSWSIMIKKLDRLKDPNLFSSWAFRIVTRKSLDFVNKRSRDNLKLKDFQKASTISEEKGDREMMIQKLMLAIQSLPDGQQHVIRLFYTEGYSLKEIANILQVSSGTVKSRLFHAREKLKLNLKERKDDR